ncbi:MAG TPA: hypothetical protein PLU85_06650 [Bacteroidia bacterium]|nr:hypothetical protein [Bacteroidia bacterium]HQZ25858.1 hypothetical protein [Flavobacterium sp.]MBP7715524.1 hypothetical protein [Bacteroidia bacterium]MBP8668663.1 hypothetical protein [Bacteroidia bacterium]HQW17486.1 hypothetical protein [Bacteroidia bacterium]
MDKKIIQKAGKYFAVEEKHKIIQELIATQCTKVQIWEKYTGEVEEHGQLLRWMRQLGYNTGIKTRRPNIVSNLYSMAQKRIKSDNPDSYREVKVGDESFENLQCLALK